MSDNPLIPDCTVTGASGTVVIHGLCVSEVSLTPAEAVEISNRLLEAAALANGQPAWKRA
jgi:hypothetical protein